MLELKLVENTTLYMVEDPNSDQPSTICLPNECYFENAYKYPCNRLPEQKWPRLLLVKIPRKKSFENIL